MSAEEESGSDEVTTATAATAAAVRDLYKQKPASKVVRVLTVLAYLLSVSLAAILLSVYYVCVWKSPELPPLNDTGLLAQRQYMPNHNVTGGGDSGVSTPALNVTNIYNATVAPSTSTASTVAPSTVAPSTVTLSLDDAELNATQEYNQTDPVT